MISSCAIKRIENQGHDFLDTFRDESIWNRAKEKIQSTTTSISMSLMLDVGKDVLKNFLLKMDQ